MKAKIPALALQRTTAVLDNQLDQLNNSNREGQNQNTNTHKKALSYNKTLYKSYTTEKLVKYGDTEKGELPSMNKPEV